MSEMASLAVGRAGYRDAQEIGASERALAFGLVLALHAAVVGGFVIAQRRPPSPPPEKTLAVSFVTESWAAPAPTPPQPPRPVPPPEPTLIATPRPTSSPMTAPPMEREPQRETPPAAPAPPASAAPAGAAPIAAALTPPNFTAAYLNNPGPAYPPSARRRREEGTVRLRVQVSAEGAPRQVLVDSSSGSSVLDAAAVEVVEKRWKFIPAKQGDRAVAAWVLVPMEFSLKR